MAWMLISVKSCTLFYSYMYVWIKYTCIYNRFHIIISHYIYMYIPIMDDIYIDTCIYIRIMHVYIYAHLHTSTGTLYQGPWNWNMNTLWESSPWIPLAFQFCLFICVSKIQDNILYYCAVHQQNTRTQLVNCILCCFPFFVKWGNPLPKKELFALLWVW